MQDLQQGVCQRFALKTTRQTRIWQGGCLARAYPVGEASHSGTVKLTAKLPHPPCRVGT
jgi:hypothetical protein